MPSTVLKKVLEAQTMAEDYEVYIPFFLFSCNREIHCIGNMGNKSIAALAISPEKGGFAGRAQDQQPHPWGKSAVQTIPSIACSAVKQFPNL